MRTTEHYRALGTAFWSKSRSLIVRMTIKTMEVQPMPHRPTSAWPVADAKARLSELIEKAHSKGPQTITRNGKPTAVVVSIDEWSRKTKRKGSLAEFFAASPLRGSGLKIERSKAPARPVTL